EGEDGSGLGSYADMRRPAWTFQAGFLQRWGDPAPAAGSPASLHQAQGPGQALVGAPDTALGPADARDAGGHAVLLRLLVEAPYSVVDQFMVEIRGREVAARRDQVHRISSFCSCGVVAEWISGSGRDRVLARAAARTLARHDRAAKDQLAAPDAPRLGALQRALEAGLLDRAPGAERLGELDVLRRLGEPQVRVGTTGDLGFVDQVHDRLRPHLFSPLIEPLFSVGHAPRG